MDNIFEMRDKLDRLVESNSSLTRGDATDIHVFRVLMLNAYYKPGHQRHGYVVRDKCKLENLAKTCSYHRDTVKISLRNLEEAGWIKRTPKSGRYGRLASDIYLPWIKEGPK